MGRVDVGRNRSIPWSEDHGFFEAELRDGLWWQRWFQARCAEFGFFLIEPTPPEGLRFRKSYADRLKYAKERDLRWHGHVVSVKSSKRSFTCVADFPFKRTGPMVDEAWKWTDPKPSLVVIISRPTRAIIWVRGADVEREGYVIKRVRDGRIDEQRTFLYVPLHLCEDGLASCLTYLQELKREPREAVEAADRGEVEPGAADG